MESGQRSPAFDGSSVSSAGVSSSDVSQDASSGPLEIPADAEQLREQLREGIDPWSIVEAQNAVIRTQGQLLSSIAQDVADIKLVHQRLLESAEQFASSPIARMMGAGGLSSMLGGNANE